MASRSRTGAAQSGLVEEGLEAQVGATWPSPLAKKSGRYYSKSARVMVSKSGSLVSFILPPR